MDWTGPPNLAKASKSKAIPIINPTSREAVPATAVTARRAAARAAENPVAQIHGRFEDVHGALHPEPKVSRQTKRNDAHAPRPAAQGLGTSAVEAAGHGTRLDDEFERGFDVYASPFIPESLRNINLLNGRVFDTGPTKWIDFVAYSSYSLSSGLLPPAPPASEAFKTPIYQDMQLGPLQYEEFFRLHLSIEMQHQQRENASYALYRHEAVAELFPDRPAQCTLIVPGLRENSPYVEEDDIVQLRQLRCDHAGRLMGTHTSFPAPATGPPPGPWTEVIYNARVSAVLRARETLVLHVLGLTLQSSEVLIGNWRQAHIPLPAKYALRFNVQFPVPMDRYLPMQHVLPRIQAALRHANNATYQQQDVAGLSDLVDLESQYWVQSMLFPTEADCDVQANLGSGSQALPLYDSALNQEQKTAVENICKQNYGVVPYLISGPPGTGKTKTLIETALQLINNVDKVSHILICAPSEPAADTLADRLRAYLTPTEMLRLNRPCRGFNEVADTLLPYCCVSRDMFAIPPFERLMAYRVVVTSCRDASMLMYARMANSDLHAVEYGLRRLIHPTDEQPVATRLHWDALLVDEAAQATEPEALVPLYVVAPPLQCSRLVLTPLVVMAGDERQLCPRTSAPATPLKRSLFARLIARPVYANHPLARGKTGAPPPPLSQGMLPILRPAFTNLVQNYRSHPAILAVPSRLFYFDTLEAAADPEQTNRLLRWPHWGGRGWPVLFHDNRSPDDLERDAGGWYNVGEAELACQYAAKLAASRLIPAPEICIMSPFKAQVRRIREVIRSPAYSLWDVNVGPTEAFQGLEFGAVILCVTRSRQRFVRRDIGLSWGIIGQPEKMNVALTRAKAGLIIIGNRDVLVRDPDWKAVVEFCERNGLVPRNALRDASSSGQAETQPLRTKIEDMLLESELG
ncbi:P-loop containing nucleoside triphosphate hydrolase protein [Diplogelasinospora grovesii]|uniref:P-loop containing nucleoside triphosphate hydrolase protein n=1 Tax=Diplogelasinospora grovesii TaxID=303347 RepID=A0AAN6RZH6_9PEZI|nr:P-loop containing nucleoside triphosphate hydrolase protein [Diplogelasinospora grovesii]